MPSSLPARCPFAVWLPISYRSDKPLRAYRNRWVLHVAGYSPRVRSADHGLQYDFESRTTNRATCTFYVDALGVIAQHCETNRQSWAQVAGNTTWMSVEVAGTPGSPMNERQLRSLAKLHVWMGADDRVTNSTLGCGIGTHSMGGKAWGGHPCPGALRAAQRATIIRYAKEYRSGRTTSQEDKLSWAEYVSVKKLDKNPITAGQAVRGAYLNSAENNRTLAAIQADLKTLTRTVEELAKIIRKG